MFDVSCVLVFRLGEDFTFPGAAKSVIDSQAKWSSDAGIAAFSYVGVKVCSVSSSSARVILALKTIGNFFVPNWFYGQGGFGWAGGEPASNINIRDFDSGVFSSSSAIQVDVYNIWITTDRLVAGNISIPGGFAAVFVEGEQEEDYLQWTSSQ